jgi:hypothetical protein
MLEGDTKLKFIMVSFRRSRNPGLDSLIAIRDLDDPILTGDKIPHVFGMTDGRLLG